MMKKTLALLLLAVILMLSFTSCGPYSDAEANEILNGILIREAELNQYIYGDAFKTKEDPGDDVNSPYQQYYEVAPDSKYLTITSLKAQVDALIVSTSRAGIYGYAFDGTSNEITSYPPRFRENEITKNLDINVADTSRYQLRTVALLNSAEVTRSNRTHIKAEITVYRYSTDGSVTKGKKDVEIRMEDGVWKLVNQTMIGGTIETAPN